MIVFNVRCRQLSFPDSVQSKVVVKVTAGFHLDFGDILQASVDYNGGNLWYTGLDLVFFYTKNGFIRH